MIETIGDNNIDSLQISPVKTGQCFFWEEYLNIREILINAQTDNLRVPNDYLVLTILRASILREEIAINCRITICL